MKVRLGFYLLVIFAVLLFSCRKNIETSEEDNNELSFEHELTDNSEDNKYELLFNDFDTKVRTLYRFSPGTKTLLYEYDGYWSMRFDEYYRLDDGNKKMVNKKDSFL